MQTRIEQAAACLVTARQGKSPLERLPEECRPLSNEEAFAIQRDVLKQRGEKIGGWKASVPHGEKMIVAPLPASSIRSGSPCPMTPTAGIAPIEPEIAYIMGAALPARPQPYSEEEIRAAIRETRLVLELMGSRYKDPGAVSPFEALADSVRHQGMFIGPLLEGAHAKALEAFHLKVTSPAGIVFERDVRHPNGHPLKPLFWLANFLLNRGEGLEAGQVITTGSYAGIIEVPMNEPLTFTYGDLGTYTLHFVNPES